MNLSPLWRWTMNRRSRASWSVPSPAYVQHLPSQKKWTPEMRLRFGNIQRCWLAMYGAAWAKCCGLFSTSMTVSWSTVDLLVGLQMLTVERYSILYPQCKLRANAGTRYIGNICRSLPAVINSNVQGSTARRLCDTQEPNDFLIQIWFKIGVRTQF